VAYPARRGRPRRRLRAVVCLAVAAAALYLAPGLISLHSRVPSASARVPDDALWSGHEHDLVDVAPPLPPAPNWDGTVAPPIQSEAAAVIDGDSGALLFGHDPHKRLPPASITKIVTAMVALEHGDLDTVVTVEIDGPKFAIETDSAVMGLHHGDRLTLRDLLYGLMLPSGNDAAVEIARAIAGNEERFVKLMNAKVQQLGLEDTHFTNPHGLHDPDHYTSAYDITQLGLWAMKDERLREIVQALKWTVHGSRTYTVINLNGLMWYYPGADGLKTGWHEQAGMTIVGSATRDGHRVFVTLLNDQKQLPDSAALLNWAFAHFTWPGQD
jgi:D-alanyl-D-alanine carboxypeptidase (penicillin-binding protein 5/6)